MLYIDNRVCVFVSVYVCFGSFQIHKHRNTVCHFVYRETECFIDNKKKERSIGMLTSLLCKNKLFMQQNIFLNKQRSVIQKLEPLKLNVCCSNELHGLGLNTVRINLHIQSSVEAFQVPLVCF